MKYLPILLLLLSFNVFADNAALTWVGTTERIDNTPLLESEIKEYRVYYGTATGNYQSSVLVSRPDAGAITPESITLTLPTGSTYYFAITTVDTDGRESGYSTEVSIPLGHENPKAPTGVIVIKITTEVIVTSPGT